MRLNLFLLITINLLNICWAWDSDEFDVFDVVEEVNENFYDFLGIKQDASSTEIKKAFRKLSLVVHPDKNDAPDAEIKFRRLVAVYEVLRDNKKRQIYEDVLINGLPNWKQASYYYRRVRKMGLVEMSIILFIIITIGQYLVAWASYFEKRYAVQEFISSKKKSLEKKQKKGKIEPGTVEMLPDIISSIPRPSVKGTLPVQICMAIWFLFVQAPPLTYQFYKDYREQRRNASLKEESSSEEEPAPVVRERLPRRRKVAQIPEISGDSDNYSKINNNVVNSQNESPEYSAPIISGGLWTDEDFANLIRFTKKYPTGTAERWEKIGEAMRRPAAEVTFMTQKIKDEGLKLFSKQTEEPTVEEPKKVKTRGGKLGIQTESDIIDINNSVNDAFWSQVQQKALETALAKYPKGFGTDRWDKIAHCVPDKSKEECMLRFKYLADLVKKKKVKENDCST